MDGLCGRRAVEVSQACRHVAGGEAAQPPSCTFSPERRGVFQPDQSWPHGDGASPCGHPGGTMPPLPWSERRYIAVRSLQEAIGRKMIGNLGDAGSPLPIGNFGSSVQMQPLTTEQMSLMRPRFIEYEKEGRHAVGCCRTLSDTVGHCRTVGLSDCRRCFEAMPDFQGVSLESAWMKLSKHTQI